MRAHLGLGLVVALIASPAMAQDTGVPACDKVLKTYESCVIPKSPDAVKPQMKTAFDAMRTNWLAVAGTPDGKKQLAGACEQASTQMKQQLASLNCTW